MFERNLKPLEYVKFLQIFRWLQILIIIFMHLALDLAPMQPSGTSCAPPEEKISIRIVSVMSLLVELNSVKVNIQGH